MARHAAQAVRVSRSENAAARLKGPRHFDLRFPGSLQVTLWLLVLQSPFRGLAMPRLNRERSLSFKVISGVTFYMGKEGAESEAGQLHVGSVLHAAVRRGEKRTLRGQRVLVILFKIGADGKGLYWLPRNEFYRCTENSTQFSREYLC
jgi:hypothetical protein